MATIEYLKNLRDEPQLFSIDACHNIAVKLCSQDVLGVHRMKSAPLDAGLSMCRQLLLSSMGEACRQRGRLSDSAHILQLQRDEANQYERARATMIF